jgi:hypothetical protein
VCGPVGKMAIPVQAGFPCVCWAGVSAGAVCGGALCVVGQAFSLRGAFSPAPVGIGRNRIHPVAPRGIAVF